MFTTASFTSTALSTTTSVTSPTFSLTVENPSLIPALADVKVSDANSPVDSTTLDTRSCKLTESASCCSLVLISITLTLTSTTSNPVILFISVVITRLISSKISGTLFLYSTMIFKSTATCSLPTSILTPDVTLSVLINLSVKFEKKPPSTASNPETFSKAWPIIFLITSLSNVNSPLALLLLVVNSFVSTLFSFGLDIYLFS